LSLSPRKYFHQITDYDHSKTENFIFTHVQAGVPGSFSSALLTRAGEGGYTGTL